MSDQILPAEEFSVLSALSADRAEGSTMFELSSRTKIVPGIVANIVGRLMDKDLVARSERTFKLTKRGYSALEKIRQSGVRFGEPCKSAEIPAEGLPDDLMEEIGSIDADLKKLKK